MREGIVLILGGARSGKSDYAQKLAEKPGKRPVFIATARAGDEEMKNRIQAHQAARGSQWQTIEAPAGVAQTVRDSGISGDVYLLDCLTLLTSNVYFQFEEGVPEKTIEDALFKELDEIEKLNKEQDKPWIMVSNEVGLGIVPATSAGRSYRDILGRLNMHAAKLADTVLFMAAGIPMCIKGELPE